ncbi:MAG: carboxypeptidase-like regulatory domain-containing protein, partial [Acidobacteriota bacterium]|nr:carboxypeptidase-like regulatory domain-containing protein [Acidobacteriota bacterium]
MNIDIRLSKTLFGLSITLFTVCLFSYTAFAQFETATVLGSVRDPNEAAVQNATVTLKNVATEITQTVTTDENGDYQFVNVKIGNYQVMVEASGFNRTVANNVNVTINARQRVDLTLQVATA